MSPVNAALAGGSQLGQSVFLANMAQRDYTCSKNTSCPCEVTRRGGYERCGEAGKGSDAGSGCPSARVRARSNVSVPRTRVFKIVKSCKSMSQLLVKSPDTQVKL